MINDDLVTERADAAVALGADLLDAYNAGDWDWRGRIDPDKFRITSYSDCAIGQLFPDYRFHLALDLIGCTDPAACGFHAPESSGNNYWNALEDAWLREISR